MRLRLLHIGDLHGHMVPRSHLRGDGDGRLQGGLARLYSVIRTLRAGRGDTLLFNTGDTIQGSAEALFTRGQALVDVLDQFGIDAFAPGNWNYLYGKARFLELFGPGSAGGSDCRWGAVAANVYDGGSGARLLPAFRMLDVQGGRVAVLGLSSERAINALGPWVTEGIRFSHDAGEIGPLIDHVQALYAPDAIVLLSEFGLAKNILIAERHPALTAVLSSDSHEETRAPVVTTAGVLISEVGQDGTRLGQFDLVLDRGRAREWAFRLHVIDESINGDPAIARSVELARSPFVSGPGFRPHVNPINGAVLDKPIDTVIGQACVDLHRSGFAQDTVPAAVHGTSSQFLAEALRRQTGADVGHMRGFRFGTHVPRGPIRLEDLYHFMPVGAQVAIGPVRGDALASAIERSADGVFNPDPFAWTGGWLDAYAGLRFAVDPVAPTNARISGLQVQLAGQPGWTSLAADEHYRVAGYWYARSPGKIGGFDAPEPDVVAGSDSNVMDACDLVARDLAENAAQPDMSGVRCITPLPGPVYVNPEIQPLRGASLPVASPCRSALLRYECVAAPLKRSQGGHGGQVLSNGSIHVR